MTIYPNQQTGCPYCGNQFKQPPMRDRRCKACGNIVMVKHGPREVQRHLATIEDAKRIDREWEEFYAEERPNAGIELQKNEWCRQYLETMLKHPDVYGVRVHRGPGCDQFGCETVERIVPCDRVFERPTIPCGRVPACYGHAVVVFKDEMGIVPPLEATKPTMETSIWWRLLSKVLGK